MTDGAARFGPLTAPVASLIVRPSGKVEMRSFTGAMVEVPVPAELVEHMLSAPAQGTAVEVLAGLVVDARAAKDAAYSERNQCVAMIAKMAQKLGWPAWLGLHDPADDKWEADWRNIVFVDLPTGQVSWHIHDSEQPNFAFLPRAGGRWDGHSTADKYERMRRWDPGRVRPGDLAEACRILRRVGDEITRFESSCLPNWSSGETALAGDLLPEIAGFLGRVDPR